MRYAIRTAVVILLAVAGCSRKDAADVAAERAATEMRTKEAKAAESAARRAQADAKAAEDRLKRAEAARAERESAEAEAARIAVRRAAAEKEAEKAEAEVARLKRRADAEEAAAEYMRKIDAELAAMDAAAEKRKADEAAEWKAREDNRAAAEHAGRSAPPPEKDAADSEKAAKTDKTDQDGPTKEKAFAAAKEEILSRLKCPSTAKFTEVRWVRMARLKNLKDKREHAYANWRPDEKSKSNVWSVIVDVDAENSYGAMVRGRWAVLVLWTGGSFRDVDVSKPD